MLLSASKLTACHRTLTPLEIHAGHTPMPVRSVPAHRASLLKPSPAIHHRIIMASKPKKHTTAPFRVWQWNCRGYRRKRGELTQFIATQPHPPDVIALQEVHCTPTLSGYNAYIDKYDTTKSHLAATLVSKHITVVEHTLDSSNIPHVLLEIVPRARSQTSLFLLNIYSAPKSRRDDFGQLFAAASKQAKKLIILGDFNAYHPAWGYQTESPKGRRLAHVMTFHQEAF